MSVCLRLCACEGRCPRGQKTALDPLELELQVAVSTECWEPNSNPLEEAASALDSRVISPAP